MAMSAETSCGTWLGCEVTGKRIDMFKEALVVAEPCREQVMRYAGLSFENIDWITFDEVQPHQYQAGTGMVGLQSARSSNDRWACGHLYLHSLTSI